MSFSRWTGAVIGAVARPVMPPARKTADSASLVVPSAAAVGGFVAELATFSAFGPVLGRRLLSGLHLALLAAATCVVLAAAELRFKGGYPGLEALIFVVPSLHDLERG